jgi:tetratricopeptide (TPR) repeat protein
MAERRLALLLVALAMMAPGCAMFPSKQGRDYRTVPASPNRDTDRAKAENEQAIRFCEKGRFDKAEKALQEALIADVTFGPAHNNLGKLYFSQGQYYLAAWEFEYAIKLMPHRYEPFCNLGLVYETVGKLDDAISMYSQAYALEEKTPEVIGNLARVRLRKGESTAEVEPLLAELVFLDTRPEWVNWAKEQLATVRSTNETIPVERLPTPPGLPSLTPLPPPPASLPAPPRAPISIER